MAGLGSRVVDDRDGQRARRAALLLEGCLDRAAYPSHVVSEYRAEWDTVPL
jgi:hypothetical protein